VPDTLDAAQSTLTDLLAAEGIRRVICVDDYYSRNQTLDGLLERTRALEDNLLPECFPEELIAPARMGDGQIDVDVLETGLGVWWEAAGDGDKQQVLVAVEARSTDQEEATEAVVMTALHKMLGATPLTQLTLAQWRIQSTELLLEKAKTLLLFDKIFSREGIDNAQIAVEAIRDALDRSTAKKLLCGLLTTTTAINEEYGEWQSLKSQYNLDTERVIVISKARLGDDPLGFPRAVKMTILAPHRRQMLSRSAKILRAAHLTALKKVDAVTPYDFEHVVFRRSAEEGVWEPDTLFRIYGVYARREARAQARADTQLQKVISASRNLAAISTISSSGEEITSWKLQHDEMYEDPEHLCAFHLPLDLGDLFETETGKQFMLLAQPCDVMIRKNGKRAGYVTSFWVVEVLNAQPSQRIGVYELPYYNPASGASAWVSFKDRSAVSPSVLDLCVYQPNGACKFVLDEACPVDVIEPLRRRHPLLSKEFKRSLELVSIVENTFAGKVRADDTKQVSSLLLRFGVGNTLIRGEVEAQNTLAFGFRRIGRLCPPWSVALLGDFAQFIARAAFEMDLGDLGA